MTIVRRLRFLSLAAACALWLAMAPATAQAAQTEPDARAHAMPDWKPSASGPVDDFPTDEIYCLAAATHVEAASQSELAKTAVAQYILLRALKQHQTICAMLATDDAIAASRAPIGSWAADVFRNGDLLKRQRGTESWLIAMEVYNFMRPLVLDGNVSHFDSCDSRAPWTDAYTRIRLDPTDSVCLWN